jgi:uncharacterized protein YecE (DUF72 family)
MTLPADTPIACGIAGWSYLDWDGFVYPPGVRDRLAFIAPYVDVIEINSTFYRPPSPSTAASWAARTARLPGFAFTAKLHRDVTHKGRIEPDMVRAFREGLAPLADAGVLRHLLAQFRYDFGDGPDNRAHLASIRDAFGAIAHLTFELRHNAWQAPNALYFLNGLGVGVANLDYPTARGSFNLRACRIGAHAYLRLHGRNADAWFSRHAGRDETYNYLYTAPELEEIKVRALDLARGSKSLTLIANNHYHGKELVNALQLKAMLTGEPVQAPPLLAARYPELRAVMAPKGA